MINQDTVNRIIKNELKHFFIAARMSGAGLCVMVGFLLLAFAFAVYLGTVHYIDGLTGGYLAAKQLIVFSLYAVAAVMSLAGVCFVWAHTLIKWPRPRKTLLVISWASVVAIVFAAPYIFLLFKLR